MRYLPSRPSSSAACGGSRKSIRWESKPTDGPALPPVTAGLLDGGTVGELPASFAAGGGTVRMSSRASLPAAGTSTACPQCGHLPFFPARASFTVSFLRHAAQERTFIEAPGTEQAGGGDRHCHARAAR